jgi:hypothetical protein
VQLEPAFLVALWKLVGKGAAHPREELANRLMMHRLMCLAFLTGMFCKLSENEIQDLVNRAKATKGIVPAAFMLAEDQ